MWWKPHSLTFVQIVQKLLRVVFYTQGHDKKIDIAAYTWISIFKIYILLHKTFLLTIYYKKLDEK